MSGRPFLAKRGSSLFNATIESINYFAFECLHHTGHHVIVAKKLDEAQLSFAKSKLKDADSVYVKTGWKGANVTFSSDAGIQAGSHALKFDLKEGIKPSYDIRAESVEGIRALAKEMRADKAVARAAKKPAKPKADLKTRRDVL